MNYNDVQYEETIDLKDLCIFILRKWKLLILSLLVGIAVFCGFNLFKALNSSDVSLSITDSQKKLAESFKQIENSIENNTLQQESNLRQINSAKMMIKDKKEEIADLENILQIYKQTLIDMQELLYDAATVEEKASIITQIASLNNTILSQKNKITSAYQNIRLYEDQIATLTVTAETLKNDAVDFQEQKEEFLKINEGIIDANGEPIPIKIQTSINIKSFIKYGLIGAFLGAFVVCGCAFLQYLFTKYLHNANELKERFKVHILGTLYTPANGKKRNVVDRALDNLSGYPQLIDEAAEYELIAARIQLFATEQSYRLMITGSVDLNKLEQVADKLKKLLPSEKFFIDAAANPVYDPESMLLLRQNTIVLVESIQTSDKKEITKLVELIHNGNAPIIGAVVL